MESTQSLCACQPLAGLRPSDRRALHRLNGMHSPNPEVRTDNDAFDVRDDVTVEGLPVQP